jgi:hypothetical protein
MSGFIPLHICKSAYKRFRSPNALSQLCGSAAHIIARHLSMFEISPRRSLTIDSTVYSSIALLSCIRCEYSTPIVYKLLLCFVRTLQKRLPLCKSKTNSGESRRKHPGHNSNSIRTQRAEYRCLWVQYPMARLKEHARHFAKASRRLT